MRRRATVFLMPAIWKQKVIYRKAIKINLCTRIAQVLANVCCERRSALALFTCAFCPVQFSVGQNALLLVGAGLIQLC